MEPATGVRVCASRIRSGFGRFRAVARSRRRARWALRFTLAPRVRFDSCWHLIARSPAPRTAPGSHHNHGASDRSPRLRCAHPLRLRALPRPRPLATESPLGSPLYARASSEVRLLSARYSKKPGTANGIGLSSKPWSQRQESNLQPSDYKSGALPLSHAGTSGADTAEAKAVARKAYSGY